MVWDLCQKSFSETSHFFVPNSNWMPPFGRKYILILVRERGLGVEEMKKGFFLALSSVCVTMLD